MKEKLIIVILLSFLIYLAIVKERRKLKLYNEYSILTEGDSLNSTILKLRVVKGGVTLVTLEDSSKVAIEHSINYSYNKPELFKNIMVGDKLLKVGHSDTIKILKSGELFTFRLGKYINPTERRIDD